MCNIVIIIYLFSCVVKLRKQFPISLSGTSRHFDTGPPIHIIFRPRSAPANYQGRLVLTITLKGCYIKVSSLFWQRVTAISHIKNIGFFFKGDQLQDFLRFDFQIVRSAIKEHDVLWRQGFRLESRSRQRRGAWLQRWIHTFIVIHPACSATVKHHISSKGICVSVTWLINKQRIAFAARKYLRWILLSCVV